MANELYLLNLDTGDFIKLGRQVSSGYGVPPNEYKGIPDVGYVGDHLLIDSLPLITSEKQSEPTQDCVLEIRRRRGHALNAFLAVSLGCRLMVLHGSTLFDSIQDAAREFHELDPNEGVFVELLGQLGSTSVGSGPIFDNGKPMSEGEFFLPEAAFSTSVGGNARFRGKQESSERQAGSL